MMHFFSGIFDLYQRLPIVLDSVHVVGASMRLRPGFGRSIAETREAADPKVGGVVALSDDTSVKPRFLGVGRDRLAGIEVPVALDWEAEPAADGREFS
jgi:hypothetical protein